MTGASAQVIWCAQTSITSEGIHAGPQLPNRLETGYKLSSHLGSSGLILDSAVS
jgi:hypothetical protein